jgi:NAD(P)-dependent dehydrogenase (short-subunit alcohol dehydrogenase family)
MMNPTQVASSKSNPGATQRRRDCADSHGKPCGPDGMDVASAQRKMIFGGRLSAARRNFAGAPASAGGLMKAAELFDVHGLVTIVTGAASGIGLAYSEVMADNGARVVMVDRDTAALTAAVEELKSAGAEVYAEPADVTDRAAVRAIFDRKAAELGSLDVVFANAGIDAGPGFLTVEGRRNPDGALENVTDDQWDKVIATNLSSVFTTIQCAARHMKARRSGRIIVTTSNAAIINESIVGTPYMPAKAAAAHLVRHAALELAKFNIRVNAIAPGAFITNIAGGRLRNAADRRAFEKRSPMKHIAATQEIMGLALFLASNASSYVTGAQIVIDGGCVLGTAD